MTVPARNRWWMPWTAMAVGVSVFWMFGLRAVQPDDNAFSSIDRLPLLIAAVLFAILAATRGRGRERTAWGCLALALLSVALGEIAWGIHYLKYHENPSFGIADVFYLTYFPLMTTAIMLMPKRIASGTDGLRFLLDAGIVVVGGGMMVWLFAVQPILARHGDATAGYVALAYAAGNLLTVLAAATVLLRLPTGTARLVYLFIGLSLLASLAGDMVWVIQQLLPASRDISHWANGLWLVQSLFLVMAGELHHRFHPDWSQAPEHRPSSPGLPYLALLLGYGLIAWAGWKSDLSLLRPLLVGGLALTLLVVLRQALAHIESARLNSERDRVSAESKLAKLIENAAEGIVVINTNCRVLYASPAVGRLLRFPHARLPERSILEFLVPDDGDSLRQSLTELDRDTGRSTRKLVLRMLPQGAGLAWVEATLSDRRRDNEVAGIVVNLRDVTEQHRLEEQMRFESLHDPLTQLPNRDMFLDRVARALAGAPPGSISVMVLALRVLRQINDSLGHSFGDQALMITADRLRAVFGGDGALARLGAEDFAVFVDSAQVDPRVAQIHAAFAEPFQLGTHRMSVGINIGVAQSRVDSKAEVLLRDADTASTRARERGGKLGYERFAAEQHEQAMAWLALQSALPDALASGRFSIHLEPIVGLVDGFPFGLRPRLRWTDASKAAFPIERVREVISSGGELGMRVGQWVIHAAEREYASVLRFLPAAGSLSLLSPVHTTHLIAGDLPARTRDRSAELGIPPVNLLFSVTESSLAPEHGGGLDRLRELRAVGARLALAEFGGRGSSLSALQEPIFDAIVLARELVARLGPGSRANALVRGVIAAAESVGTRVIAAGVDTDIQKEVLIDQGCLYGMGPALAKPMAAEHLLPWLGARFNERDTR